ncbi:MAG: peptidylprolyl isomerase [Anaerolineaceae bacterium]|nr:peptidylprolyl isomerase [Anaerolineaceae bacterium]
MDHKTAGAEFLENNAKRDEVKTTSSGLQYVVVEEGQGPKPGPTDTVEVHYRGTLIDGTEFDSSYKRGQTISFPLNRVIAGWTEGVQLMSPGAKYTFYIPYNLAYGERGTPGGPIPGYAALIFDVELVSIK